MGLIWSISELFGPIWARFGPNSAHFCPIWAYLGQFLADLACFDSIWPIGACFGPFVGYLGLFCLILGKLEPNFDRFGPVLIYIG